jgi:hypothetical protein
MTHAKSIFPDQEERRSVRRIMLSVSGTITRITESDGTVIYENNSFEQRKCLTQTNIHDRLRLT